MKRNLVAALAVASGITLLAGCGSSSSPSAHDVEAQMTKINKLSGDAREQALYKQAKKEGTVTWYTGLIPAQIVIPIQKAFEAKYPGITLKYYRAGSSEIASKILLEAKSRDPKSDVFDGAHAGVALKAAGASQPYTSPSAASMPADMKDPDGYWTAVNLYVKGVAYNTDKIKPADAPKTFADLLDPKYKGKMVWTPESTGGADFLGNVLHTLGQSKTDAFVAGLAKQDVKTTDVSSKELVDAVVAGQYPIALQVFNNHVALDAKQGGHIAFTPLDAASEELNPIGLTANDAHPFAGRLLIDFLLSTEGQQVFRDNDYIPANPAVHASDPSLDPRSGSFKVDLLSPDTIDKEGNTWMDLFDRVNKG
jgi:ABC-type Fe3+ transport system substrate-binding protein/outer membrane murein-binding lipoprotein Lpp